MPDPDLFSEERSRRRGSAAPLATRMRPRHLDEVVGQRHLLAPDAAFRAMLESGRPSSMILWGPPGTGKTTLARLVAAAVGARFEQLSATSAGVKDVREVVASAAQRLEEGRGRTVLFLDEIHRFSKAQQDALLPAVEDGIVVLVGATTENPYFEVNDPLLSRTTIFRTEPLDPDDVLVVLERAVADPMIGLGMPAAPAALRRLAARAGGDARLALNALETAGAVAAGRDHDRVETVDVEEVLRHGILRYDRAGDRHYDVASAFIKSVRGSDVDAALYWLHTMLGGGEDPKFIARRLVILASEDIGPADPQALGLALDAFRAVEVVGLPEAAYALTHVTIHLAAAPKSNSVARAMQAARRAVEQTPGAPVPPHLRSAVSAAQRAAGDGVGYVYAHDGPGNIVRQRYLPDGLEDVILYVPGATGAEADLARRLREVDERLGRRGRGTVDPEA